MVDLIEERTKALIDNELNEMLCLSCYFYMFACLVLTIGSFIFCANSDTGSQTAMGIFGIIWGITTGLAAFSYSED